MPEGLEALLPVYRLVVDGLATWTEVTTMMTIDDVQALGIIADAIAVARNPPGEGARR